MRRWFWLAGLLLVRGEAAEVRFEKHVLDTHFRSEGVAVADFTNDGRLDIAAGTLLYRGPDWQPQPLLGDAREFDPRGYSDAFLCFAGDINRDGWADLVVVGFPGGETVWLQNPGGAGGPWTRRPAIQNTGNESPLWVDVDRDGRGELLFVSGQGIAVARPRADLSQLWEIFPLAAAGEPAPGHGLGFGDVDGDGFEDVVCPEGWWKGCGNPTLVPWPFHRAKLSESCAQMAVMDADGDGDADILSSSAHGYGVWWAEQTPEGWLLHEIDRSVSQTHALHLGDLNRDGLADFLTGKRFWAHTQGDPGIDEPSLLCWFELQRREGRPVWTRHVIDDDSGVGLHALIVDINLDGRLDVVSSNKKGVHLFLQVP